MQPSSQKGLPTPSRLICVACLIAAILILVMWLLTSTSMIIFATRNAYCYSVGGGLLELGYIWDANRFATIRNSGYPHHGWYYFTKCDYSNHLPAWISITFLHIECLLASVFALSRMWQRLVQPPFTPCVRTLLIWAMISTSLVAAKVKLYWYAEATLLTLFAITITIAIPIAYHPWGKKAVNS